MRIIYEILLIGAALLTCFMWGTGVITTMVIVMDNVNERYAVKAVICIVIGLIAAAAAAMIAMLMPRLS